MNFISSNNKATVLVVDDMSLVLDILVQFLEQAGYEVVTSKDGKSALHIAVEVQPDIILLDVMMPGMNGLEVCQRLKENQATKDIPVIFTTALTEINDKLKGFQAGAADYITKPFDLDELLARIEIHINVSNLQKRLRAEIAEREKAKGSLHQYIAELKARNKALDAFTRSVAHSLKNPLGVITGMAEILVSEYADQFPDDLQISLEAIARSGRKATHIINELLALASVHKQDVELMPLDMEEIISEVQQRLAHTIRESQAKIILPASWPVTLGHAPWIEEVWINYVSNAIKYGGRPPHIELGATAQLNGTVRFWVKDNGPGLMREEQDKLFIPFTQFSKIRTDGHGLGLSIVQSIVEKLGGEVGVQSEGVPGRGSVFSFVLTAVPRGLKII